MGHIFVNSSEVLTQCNHISEISSQLSLFDEKIKSTQRQLQRNMDLYRDDINTRFDKVLSLVSHDVIAIKQLGSSCVSILQQYLFRLSVYEYRKSLKRCSSYLAGETPALVKKLSR